MLEIQLVNLLEISWFRCWLRCRSGVGLSVVAPIVGVSVVGEAAGGLVGLSVVCTNDGLGVGLSVGSGVGSGDGPFVGIADVGSNVMG